MICLWIVGCGAFATAITTAIDVTFVAFTAVTAITVTAAAFAGLA